MKPEVVLIDETDDSSTSRELHRLEAARRLLDDARSRSLSSVRLDGDRSGRRVRMRALRSEDGIAVAANRHLSSRRKLVVAVLAIGILIAGILLLARRRSKTRPETDVETVEPGAMAMSSNETIFADPPAH